MPRSPSLPAKIPFLIWQVWVPTSFVKEGLVASGVPASKVFVVPHGYGELADVDAARGDGAPGVPYGARQLGSMKESAHANMSALLDGTCGGGAFVFLFLGGMLIRKAPLEVRRASFG